MGFVGEMPTSEVLKKGFGLTAADGSQGKLVSALVIRWSAVTALPVTIGRRFVGMFAAEPEHAPRSWKPGPRPDRYRRSTFEVPLHGRPPNPVHPRSPAPLLSVPLDYEKAHVSFDNHWEHDAGASTTS